MKNTTQHLFDKLNEFISKFYKNQLIRGGIYSASVLLIFFLVFSVLEYYSQFDIIVRSILFWTYVIINAFILYRFVIVPLLHLYRYGKIMSMEKAAEIIGKHFSGVDDKLLNVLELNKMSEDDNTLIQASINQKISEISSFSFSAVINFSENKKYTKWIAFPLLIVLFFFASGNKHILTESSARIIKHNTFFEPKAPFNFIIDEENLEVIMQNDFKLKLHMEGNSIPSMVYIEIDNHLFNLPKDNATDYHFLFKNVVSERTFRFAANGFYSKNYTLSVLPKPAIINFELLLSPPKYTGLKTESLTNIGDLTIPEGTHVNWSFDVKNTDRLFLEIETKRYLAKQITDDRMAFNYQFKQSEFYQIITENDFLISDSIAYHINIIPDAYPTIIVEQEIDSIGEKIFFSGIAKDDYKISKLEFCYQIKKKDSTIIEVTEITIEKVSQQQFFHHTDISILNLELGDKLTYYFKLWDNDGVNGSKFTKSQLFNLNAPNAENLNNQLEKEENRIKSDLQKSINLAKDIKKDIKSLNKDLLEKKKLGWEEKKKMEALVEKQKALQNQMTQLKEKNSAKQKKLERYKKVSPELLEKQKQLEKLFDEVLDEETKKLLEEMQKMMEEMNKEDLKEMLDKMEQDDADLEKELDRNLELFKQLEFEQKLEQALDKVKELKEKQKELKEKTDDKKSDTEKLAKEQENLKKEFDDLKKEIEQLEEKNQQLEEKNKMPNTETQEKEISEKMQESKDALEKNKKKKSSKSQDDALEKMDELEQKLQTLQASSCSSAQEEDMETLRQILENLIHLSFEQEDLMQKVKVTPKNSPSYVNLVKTQKKLVDDAVIIEDSLFALSKRVVQIQHAVNKEIALIKNNMSFATKNLEERIVNKAMGEQQFAMTSANNLALILSEMLNQMQKDLANKQKGSKQCNKQCNKPGSGKPSLSKLKKMQKKLNEQMKGMMGKKGKKKGEKLNNGQCKNLSKLSQQQESIRKQLQELRDEIGKSGEKGNIDKMIKKMEENEIDIVNNKITQETIRRQEDILSRLLEAEKAEREKEEEPKKESIEWKYELINTNNSYSDYKKQKEKQMELLKTKPAQLSPFYKKKVSEYFNELSKKAQ
ncbi:MAG: hypothetical protein H8E84_04300 [Flavobacteriales bacterium]|nr:hypothetical protein [Flavobacteriales bacterium]